MVRCVECGYIAVRNVDSNCLDEAGNDFREKGLVALGREHGRNQYQLHERQPVCFVQCYDLRAEIRQAFVTGKDETGCVLQVISMERECNGFTKWQQGFAPKEHREMLDRRWMLDFQSRRENEDREWREKQRNEDLAWREIQEKKADNRHSTELWIIGGVVTVALILGSILAAIVERGYLWPLLKIVQ